MSRDMRYTYLFPFEKVPFGARIVLYGAGIMGSEYLQQLIITQYAKVLCFIDKDFNKFAGSSVPVFGIDHLLQIDYDYIVIALRTGTFADDVCRNLKKIGIPETKIVCVLSRPEPEERNIFSLIPSDNMPTFSFSCSSFVVAIRLNSAIGDNIIRKKFVEILLHSFPDLKLDLFSPVAELLLTNLYHEYLENGRIKLIQDNGYLYNQNTSRYVMAISVYDYLQIDYDNLEREKESHPLFYKRMCQFKEYCREQQMGTAVPVYVFFMRALKKKKNCYTVFGNDGVFDISDKNVQIFLDPSYQERFNDLHLSTYVTINYGNAVSSDENSFVAKQWPLEYFHKFVALFKEKYPQITVIQLGGISAAKIEGVNMYVLGQEIELVEYILKNSILHVDIEGGLVHLATQLGTKCVVLFGPTPVEYWGYEQNINITAGNCLNCYGMYSNINKCARDLEKPECMWSITPEMVMEKVEDYLCEQSNK